MLTITILNISRWIGWAIEPFISYPYHIILLHWLNMPDWESNINHRLQYSKWPIDGISLLCKHLCVFAFQIYSLIYKFIHNFNYSFLHMKQDMALPPTCLKYTFCLKISPIRHLDSESRECPDISTIHDRIKVSLIELGL